MPNYLTSSIAGAALASGLVWASATLAQADNNYLVDSVFNLFSVRDVTLDGDSSTLLITMPDKVLRYSTFPLQVMAEIDIEIDGITSVITQEDDLVILGDGSRSGLGGGSILVFKDVSSSESGSITALEPFALDITPFSQAVLTKDGDFFAVNPIWYSAIQISTNKLIEYLEAPDEKPFWYNNLFLKCGTSSKLSIFYEKDTPYYVTSVIDAKLIEYGPLVLNDQKLPDSDCFDPQQPSRSLKSVREETAGRSLLHEIIDNPWIAYGEFDGSNYEATKRLLTFDAENGLVSVFPIRLFRGKLAMLRSERYDFDLSDMVNLDDLPEEAHGLMSSSDDGETILVSYVGSKTVYRLRQHLNKDAENELILLGRTEFKHPVRFLSVSKDGTLASVVMGEVGEEEQMVLIKNPKNIEGSGPLKRERFTVLNVQETLVNEGYELKVDGIYGRETEEAITAFESNLSGPAIGAVAAPRSMTRALELVPSSSIRSLEESLEALAEPMPNTSPDTRRPLGLARVPDLRVPKAQQPIPNQIKNKIKGLFPLNNR